MSVIVTASAVLALMAAGLTVVYAFTVRRHASGAAAAAPSASPAPGKAGALADPRSCFQASLELISDTLDAASEARSELAHTAALAMRSRMIVRLLEASPAIAFSSVIADRTLADIERVINAKHVWIVSADESIEFEYADPSISFSGVVFDNLRRGVEYRYLSIDTPAARDRAHRVLALIDAEGLAERFAVRFLSTDFWSKLHAFTETVVIFDGARSDVFYLFPDVTPIRRWVQAPEQDAKSRTEDVRATWDLAVPFDAMGSAHEAYA
jgi:hypothetical protein